MLGNYAFSLTMDILNMVQESVLLTFYKILFLKFR